MKAFALYLVQVRDHGGAWKILQPYATAERAKAVADHLATLRCAATGPSAMCPRHPFIRVRLRDAVVYDPRVPTGPA